MDIKNLVFTTAGAGLGSLVTWLCVKNHYATIADEEIASVKEYYKNELIEELKADMINQEKEDAEKEVKKVNKEEPDYQGIITKLNYGSYSQKEEKKVAVPVKEEEKKKPYIIDVNEFADDCNFEKVTITYFEGDGVFLDEEDEEISDGVKLICEDNINQFSKYDDVCYVRNEETRTDYEVILDDHSSSTYFGR